MPQLEQIPGKFHQFQRTELTNLGTDGLGILNILYFPEYDTLYFTSGLEQHIVLKLDPRDKIYKVETQYPEFQKKYYEKIIGKFEEYLFFRNRNKNIQVFDKIGEGGPMFIGDFTIEVGEQIVDFAGYRVNHQTFIAALLSDGWVSICRYNTEYHIPQSMLNSRILLMPSLKLNLSPGEKLISCAVSDDQTILVVSSLFECEDAPRCFRMFVFEINPNSGILRFIFVQDLSKESFCNYPNSFLQYLNIVSTPEAYVKKIVAFPHAGGSERIDMFLDLSQGDIKVVNSIPEYHTRSILGAAQNGQELWSIDGNGQIAVSKI